MTLEPNIVKRGDFNIRLATSADEIRVAQRLRYIVFHLEMGANLSAENHSMKTESDEFDDICDHLLVIRKNDDSGGELSVHDGSVIATYRLLRQSVASLHDGFYSQTEFDVDALIARKPELKFLELGRSCVSKNFRGSTVIELLWQGIWNYVRQHHIDVMIGCASFEGINVEAHRLALQFILHDKTAHEWIVHANAKRRLNLGSNIDTPADPKLIAASLPPLVKGYMRLGCYFARDAVIDDVFNTIDVLVILPVTQINPRYFARFGELTN